MYRMVMGIAVLWFEASSLMPLPIIPVRGSAAPPICQIIGTQKMHITCTYSAISRSHNEGPTDERIVLNRAVFSFETKGDDFMTADLTFTNEGAKVPTARYTVYLTIEDAEGRNMVRRVLSKMDFRSLTPGESVTFSERCLIGAFRPGRYAISLLIPNPDPTLKNDLANDVFLSSEGVPNRATGLNTIAHFTVE